MLNKAILIGNMGGDPVINTVGETKVARFSLATSETFKDKQGQKQSKTEWHTIVAWDKLAGVVQNYLKKGSKIYVEGKINYRKYKDQAGVEKSVTEIRADTIKMLDGKKGDDHGSTHQEPAPESKSSAIDPDDLPF